MLSSNREFLTNKMIYIAVPGTSEVGAFGVESYGARHPRELLSVHIKTPMLKVPGTLGNVMVRV